MDSISSIEPGRHARLAAGCAAIALVLGTIAAFHYHAAGLTLSHYDARGHLVVARRIIDSITPGWQQIGAVWLPLPHLLNMLPVQVDAWYRSGASAVATSIASFAIAAGAIAWIVDTLTGSAVAAAIGAAFFALNPNVLYLQSTPMTEPLLLALTTTGVAMSIARLSPRATSIVLTLACMTRYEAWPITVCALGSTAWTLSRRGAPWSRSWRDAARIGAYPATAIVAFVVFSRIVVGQWFVSGGFFVPENKSLGDPLLAAAEIWWGTRMLSGSLLIVAAAAGLVGLLGLGLFSRDRSEALVALSLASSAALPWAAFVKGHPFRIRYMVPLIAIEAVGAGAVVGLVRRGRAVVAIAMLALMAYELRPLDSEAPMVVEAQWDRPNVPVRRTITDCLRASYDGETIMASMGSLGHYMQEAAAEGFEIRDFLHEGNGDLWLAALDGPRPFAGWVLIEEKANGGDMLSNIARKNPHFLDGFSRVCEGAGVALYRRQNRTPIVKR